MLAEICAYYFFAVFCEFFLKYLEISFTFLAVFARIEGERDDIYKALTMFLPLKIVSSLVN